MFEKVACTIVRGGTETVNMVRLVRHRQTKGSVTDRPNLKELLSVFYSTHRVSEFGFENCVFVDLTPFAQGPKGVNEKRVRI